MGSREAYIPADPSGPGPSSFKRVTALLLPQSSKIVVSKLDEYATVRTKTATVHISDRRAEILDGLRLRGDETLLDLGCGRGAVLLTAAKLLPNGRAIGVDIWRADQTDNSAQNTLRNAELEGVADRVEVRTADITDLPFDDNSVDVIVSSLVVHNISNPAGRPKAISEAARVLRPCGRLVLADIWATRRHVRQLRELGWPDVRRRGLGWRMWWGPGMGTHLITATKPA